MDGRAYEVNGYDRKPLPCVRYGNGSDRAAIVFPGACRAGYRLGGSPARPDLNFTRALLVEHGFDVLEVWWDSETKPESSPEWYRANARAAVGDVGEDRLALLVGRSMGTVALSLLPELSHLKSIWIAPLTTLEPVREGLAAWHGPKLVVAGDADEAFIHVPGVETVLVPNGDHGLNVGDAATSARALADALDEMRLFIST